MTEKKRVREVWFNTGPSNRLLIVPSSEDRYVNVYCQYHLGEGTGEEEWHTDCDAGISIEAGLLPSFIDALKDILDGLNARPLPSEEQPK